MNNRVINVLRQDVYQDCHIKGTINVPLGELETYANQFLKDAELIVYCAHYNCPLSHSAWHLLHNLGYTNIHAYEGGMAEWYKSGLPTEGVCSLDYLHEPHEKTAEDTQVKEIKLQELKKKLGF